MKLRSKNTRYILWMIAMVFLISCKEKNKQSIVKSMNDIDSIPQIKQRVLLGDTTSYKELRIIYLDEGIGRLLSWSLLMSNKYNYGPAYFDVYYLLLTTRNLDVYSIDSLDNKTKDSAMYYLMNAVNRKEDNAVVIWDSLKNKSLPSSGTNIEKH